MLDLKKLFSRHAASASRDQDPDSDYHPSQKPGDGLEVEYQRLIAHQFRRWGISSACTTVEVKRLGHAPDGFDVLIGMVRMTRWERISGLRMLLGLPLLEGKIRKAVRATWLADYSHFAGLWVHASEQMHPCVDLHELLTRLVPFAAQPSPVAMAANDHPGSAIATAESSTKATAG